MSNSRPWPYGASSQSRSPDPSGRPPVPPPRRGQRPAPRSAAPATAQSASQSAARSRRAPAAAARSPQPIPRPQPEVAALRSQLDTAPPEASPKSALWIRLASNWTLWALVFLALFGGVATASAVSLFRIPNLPNCRAIFWPLAAASTRLQCADAYADQGSVDSLLAAIALVEKLPDDHPLQADISERVERWSEQILAIADRTFHAGDLTEAMAIAQRIPSHTAAAALVSDRLATWDAIWTEATSLFETAEDHLKASRFREAFSTAIQLRSVDNDYWATTKYDELLELISTARQDVNRLGQARRLADRGSVSAIVEALELINAIGDNSPLYGEAQGLMREISRDLLTLAEDALGREDSSGALNILDKIPPAAGLGAEIADFRTLAAAYELTWDDSVVGYETAIVRLQSIGRDRPLYGRAQELMQRWRRETQGLAQLDWARRVAEPGTVADLYAAIAAAEEMDRNNPRWSEAQQQIDRWQREISRIEDGPYLDQARALAAAGNRAALVAAIEAARQIDGNSALYGEAQDLIGDWRWQIQRQDNAPILAQARQMAATGNLEQAIAIARQIPQGQALHSDAQDLISSWRGDLGGSEALQQAYATAQSGTIGNLVQAIRLAQDVPQSSQRWGEAQDMIDQWSWDILRTAELEASRSLPSAIDVARQVPPRTAAYASAQLRIEEWSAGPIR